MTDIKDCCCCGKVYKKPKHKEFSLHSARHQCKCMIRYGILTLLTSYERAQLWVATWADQNEDSGTWKIKTLSTGYYAVTERGN